MYSKILIAGWADMDFNSHMRNTAFLDKSADVRMMYFSENGFPTREFTRLRLGPVVMKDEVEYRKEVSLLQEITVTLAIAGHSGDGSRFLLRNEICLRRDTLCHSHELGRMAGPDGPEACFTAGGFAHRDEVASANE